MRCSSIKYAFIAAIVPLSPLLGVVSALSMVSLPFRFYLLWMVRPLPNLATFMAQSSITHSEITIQAFVCLYFDFFDTKVTSSVDGFLSTR